MSDISPRLAHSNPNIRKKTVAALYRLALVYPDTLRSAWPKIKDMLMDEDEDSSVTAAVVNVVCELGWRRPKDFLSLAPRLFDLLVDGGNNWMAIKIIKLFATLTPLEPRLIKKLLPPLTNLIRTTPAMSLLYECINGVIQGGILDDTDGAHAGEEIASLCVSKLRGMIVLEGDPNLKYVALLAFNRIVNSHPYLVSMHQDVIMDCIDDPDISIRLQALDLSMGMVNSDNLVAVVERLMQQLRRAPASLYNAQDGRSNAVGVEPAADSDDQDPEEILKPTEEHSHDVPSLPSDYRINTIRRIIEMCSRDVYANISEFEWYVGILLQLAKLVPTHNTCFGDTQLMNTNDSDEVQNYETNDVTSLIGSELLNVAVRVSTIRSDVAEAAYSLMLTYANGSPLTQTGAGGVGVLAFAAWIFGEYCYTCASLNPSLEPLTHPKVQSLPATVISAYLQAIPKVLVSLVSRDIEWSSERQSMMSLTVARVIHFLEPLTTHPSVDLQERAVEFLELMRVVLRATTDHDTRHGSGPLLLTKVLRHLFEGSELKPVAPIAQRKVPLPVDLDLDKPINQNLAMLLQYAEQDSAHDTEAKEFELFYNKRQDRSSASGLALDTVPSSEPRTSSYQRTEGYSSDIDTSQKRFRRRERNKDDPFYIGSEETSSGTSTPFHDILKGANGDEVDVDSIPIMDLDLGEKHSTTEGLAPKKPKRHRPKKVHVTKDETIENEVDGVGQGRSAQSSLNADAGPQQRWRERSMNSLLQVDSSGLSAFPLTSDETTSGFRNAETRGAQDEEMAKALAEVERLRLEMQRASERVEASDGAPPEGTLVRKKNKKAKLREGDVLEVEEMSSKANAARSPQAEDAIPIGKRKKKKKKMEIT